MTTPGQSPAANLMSADIIAWIRGFEKSGFSRARKSRSKRAVRNAASLRAQTDLVRSLVTYGTFTVKSYTLRTARKCVIINDINQNAAGNERETTTGRPALATMTAKLHFAAAPGKGKTL